MASYRLVSEYGGTIEEWSKVTSGSYKAADGTIFENHAYRNTASNKIVEVKTIALRNQ
ncbi:hypothetical protein ABK905_12800 [Acerihabitans sp. KWT182]|uniref:Uncharacterized protein n=1 Tax=Acerihabitans sp. KWT182 TaxID=3157919 RepID=A0AAU7QFL3_9GAMM